MYDPVHHAKRKEVWKSIEDLEAECFWNPQDDDNTPDELTQAMVQEEVPTCPVAEEFIEGLDETLTDEQATMVTDLFRSLNGKDKSVCYLANLQPLFH